MKPLWFQGFFGGDKRDRTADLLNAIQALSQLSYTPIFCYVSTADLLNIADAEGNVNPLFCIFGDFAGSLSEKSVRTFPTSREDAGTPASSYLQHYTFSLSFLTSFRLATTIPVSANRAITLGSTMRLLNISVTSHTKSLPDTVPRKMNTRAMTV